MHSFLLNVSVMCSSPVPDLLSLYALILMYIKHVKSLGDEMLRLLYADCKLSPSSVIIMVRPFVTCDNLISSSQFLEPIDVAIDGLYSVVRLW